MRRWWSILCASRRGKRDRNEDFLTGRQFFKKLRPVFTLLLACDGVGGRPGGAECAHEIGIAVNQAVEKYLLRKGLASLGKADEAGLKEMILQVPVSKITEKHAATTLALAIYDHRRGRSGRILIAWAGDTQVRLMDDQGQCMTLTCDHLDEDNRLTAGYDADGRAHGLEVGIVALSFLPLAVSITTDGVHEKCTPEEWRRFMAYCLLDRRMDDERFGNLLESFLEENISDNLSACVLLRRRQVPDVLLKQILTAPVSHSQREGDLNVCA